ncbi:MAG: dephospho-CoA kinase [Lutibacter sp.]|nr:dephospho-CoA kinase [Lutibacter sp.]
MVIGLTGGIGSGKTTVLQFFKELGAAVFIADIEAKELMVSNATLKSEIINLFGVDAYINKELNRKLIASIVFNDDSKLKELNSLVHPKLREHFNTFKSTSTSKIMIYEAAILFESGSNEICDYVITVTANFEEKLERVIKRDGVTKEEILSRMQHQLNDEAKIKKSTIVIVNNKLNYTKQQVFSVYEMLLKLVK